MAILGKAESPASELQPPGPVKISFSKGQQGGEAYWERKKNQIGAFQKLCPTWHLISWAWLWATAPNPLAHSCSAAWGGDRGGWQYFYSEVCCVKVSCWSSFSSTGVSLFHVWCWMHDKSAGDTRCYKISLSSPDPCWPNQRLLPKHQLCATTLLQGLVESHCCLGLQRGKQVHQGLFAWAGWGLHSAPTSSAASPSPRTPKREVKSSHLALGGRKENSLAVEGKTATICYSNQESLLGTGQWERETWRLKGYGLWRFLPRNGVYWFHVWGQTHPSTRQTSKGPFECGWAERGWGPGGA